MRRRDRALSRGEAESILRQGEYGVLTVVGRNGYPHPVPVNYVYADGAIWIHCAKEGSKLDEIRADSRVSFCVVGKTDLLPAKFSTKYESVVVYGRAAEVAGAEKERRLTALIDKYAPNYRAEGARYIQRAQNDTTVLQVVVEHITGKARR